MCSDLFFCNDTATTEIYTLSLHDALPISQHCGEHVGAGRTAESSENPRRRQLHRSEEHTSELQSRENLVCRLLLEKKNISQSVSCYYNFTRKIAKISAWCKRKIRNLVCFF